MLRCSSLTEVRQHLNAALEKVVVNDELERQARWTQAIAVGERAFVEAIAEPFNPRQQMMITEQRVS